VIGTLPVASSAQQRPKLQFSFSLLAILFRLAGWLVLRTAFNGNTHYRARKHNTLVKHGGKRDNKYNQKCKSSNFLPNPEERAGAKK
jgi:hypothetical protein